MNDNIGVSGTKKKNISIFMFVLFSRREGLSGKKAGAINYFKTLIYEDYLLFRDVNFYT